MLSVLLNKTFPSFFTHFIYGHTVNDHSNEKKKKKLRPLNGLFFSISSKVSFIYAPSHRRDSTHHTLSWTSCGALVVTIKIIHAYNTWFCGHLWTTIFMWYVHTISITQLVFSMYGAANRKEYPMWQQRVSFLAIWVVLYHMSDTI